MIISKYLTREVFISLLGITGVLLLALLSQQIVRYLNYVVVGKVATKVLLQLISFEIPYLSALLLPLGLYLAVLVVYGRLYSNNEMAILQMYGYSLQKIYRLTLQFAFAIFLLVLTLMLWVNPYLSTKRQMLMEGDEATLHLIETLIPGRFQASPDGTHVMYVEKLSRNRQRAENIFLAKKIHNDDTDSWMIVLAKDGYQYKNKVDKNDYFVVHKGYRYEGIPGQNDYKLIQFNKYAVRILQSKLQITHHEEEALPTFKLWQHYHQPKVAAELQWRLSIPLECILLALLAVPLSTIQPRQGKAIVIIPAILIYIIYFNLLIIAKHWVEQNTLPIYIGLWWVHALVLLLLIAIVSFNHRFFSWKMIWS